MTEKSQMKVVIVGGSVAGLTLAHCLDRYGIDYVVLERRNDIAPHVGASLSVMPNGSRIMDQLGLFDEIASYIEPCIYTKMWDTKGTLLLANDAPVLTEKRVGYTLTFLEREILLEILHRRLPDKSKVLTGKYVRSIEQNTKEAVVICEDGSKYTGDVIAGADGIHSVIRKEMQREIANEGTAKDLEALKRDNISLSSEYSCLFGISDPTPNLAIGCTHRSMGKGVSSLVYSGKNGRVYWFLFTLNGKKTFGDDIPRYKKGDETSHIAKYMHHYVAGKVQFSEVWKRRITTNLVPLEEMENEHWVWNRVACLGDSIHKMTPNLGQGANCAIESAAELANSLAKTMRGGKPTYEDIKSALSLYHEKRNVRANTIVKGANKFTRVEALATTSDWITSMFILPQLGDLFADRMGKLTAGATKLDCLPLPKRTLEGTQPWTNGIGKEESKKWRAQVALPLLLAGLWFFWNRVPDSKMIPAGTSLSELKFDMLASIANLLPLVSIWTIESYRRGNVFTIANIFPTAFLLLAQRFGTGLIAPIYFFFHYVQLPPDNFAAIDNRLTNMAFVKTFLPAIFLVFLAPAYAIWNANEVESVKLIYDNVWYWFPVYLAVSLKVLKFIAKDTTRSDRIYKPTADLTYLRIIYSISIIICGSFHLHGMTQLVRAGLDANSLWGTEQTFSYGAALYWALLHFADLKSVGRLNANWLLILTVLLFSTVIAGPGGALLVMWAWREEILAKKPVASY